jgi:hypothetical protein
MRPDVNPLAQTDETLAPRGKSAGERTGAAIKGNGQDPADQGVRRLPGIRRATGIGFGLECVAAGPSAKEAVRDQAIGVLKNNQIARE